MVSTATGHLAFAVTDLELSSGVLPIMLERAYASDRREDVGLGTGWSFVFDDRITLDHDSATLTTGTGSGISFRRDGQTQHFVLQIDEPSPHQSFDITDKGTLIEHANGFTRTYTKLGATYRLSQISDPNNNAINISFDDRANVKQIANNSGASLTLEWSSDKTARLLAVTDSTNRRVAFKQDGQRLRAVTDATGAQWTYNYESNQLTRAADPLNHTLLRVRYDKAGRVVEAGDAAGTSTYEYDLASNAVSRRTVVTDQLNAQTTYEHTERGAVAAITTDEGQTVRFEYNAANRPVRISNSLGDETKFTFDRENQLLRQISSDGTDKSFAYDEKGQIASTTENGERTDYARGNVVVAKSSDPTKSYRVELDARGQATSISSESGRKVILEHDAAGNETAVTYSDVGRFEKEYDAAGRVSAERLPSGLAQRYEYDARGSLAKRIDSRGRSVRIERDESGAATGIVTGKGDYLRATRDEAGRVVATTASDGRAGHFAYDARGALTDATDERGRHRKYTYDHRGHLQSIHDDSPTSKLQHMEDGVRFVAARYEAGQPFTLKPVAMQEMGMGPESRMFYYMMNDMWAWGDNLGGGGSGGSGGGATGETREQCIARHNHACDLIAGGCLATGESALIGGVIFCEAGSAGFATPFCLAGGVIGSAGVGVGCALYRAGCRLNAPDGCPQ